ncbi:PTS sugar transporter subunit IIA [Salmonella enterica subsp. enterica serovar Choleraesuis]|nr:PTS sugar transporter subunit IIA [Salmonella enterica subsp. enterica serovar Choleraesuis]
MLGWVIACHGYKAEEFLERLTEYGGSMPQCRAINYWEGLSHNMLGRMMCDAMHETDSGQGVIFLTDKAGAAPYCAAALMSHKHPHCEVISGISFGLLLDMLPWRSVMSSQRFRQAIVARGGDSVTSLWHQQQKNPPFVLIPPAI